MGEEVMGVQKIKELALANGFSLKEQASGNMDLHSYVYEFANAIAVETLNQAQLVFGQDGVTVFDTESLDSEISNISSEFEAEYFFDNDDADRLELLVAKAMKLGELYERQKWQAAKASVAEGFVLVEKKDTEDWYLDEGEGLYMDEPDNWLCDLDIGEVQAVEHKEYLITESNTLYATKVWNDQRQSIDTWEFFKTEEEANKAAAYCKTKFNEDEVQEQNQ